MKLQHSNTHIEIHTHTHTHTYILHMSSTHLDLLFYNKIFAI